MRLFYLFQYLVKKHLSLETAAAQAHGLSLDRGGDGGLGTGPVLAWSVNLLEHFLQLEET